MGCKGIIIERDALTIRCEPHSDAQDARYRQEEDIWSAIETLGRLIVRKWPEVPACWVGVTWQNYLMILIKPISLHYGVPDDLVLRGFLNHYMASILTSGKHGISDDVRDNFLPYWIGK